MINFILYLIFLPHINGLKSDSFAERERSEKILSSYSWITFRFLDKNFDDLEQKYRAKKIVDKELNLKNSSCISVLFSPKRTECLIRISNNGIEREYVSVFPIMSMFYHKKFVETIGKEHFVERSALTETSKKATKILRHLCVPRIFVEKLQNYMREKEERMIN